MVCIYCGKSTEVTNSRASASNYRVWRRRRCSSCNSIFTTSEQTDYNSSLVVAKDSGSLAPFSRDNLFISIHESCKHRPNSIYDATWLTNSVMAKLLKTSKDGVISRRSIFEAVDTVLSKFDKVAAVHYKAYYFSS